MEQINLNLIPGRALPVCHVSQYDVGRTIRFNLFEGDQVFALATGDTAEVHVRKPDDTVVTAALTVVNAQTYLDVVTTQQMDAVGGSNICEIQIVRGGNTLGTLNFIMEVEPDPMDGSAIGSQSDIRDLDAQVAELVEENIDEQIGYNIDAVGGALFNGIERLGTYLEDEQKYPYPIIFEQGNIDSSEQEIDGTTRVRTNTFYSTAGVSVTVPSGLICDFRYYDNNFARVSARNGVTNTTEQLYQQYPYFRCIVKNSAGTDIVPNEANKVLFYKGLTMKVRTDLEELNDEVNDITSGMTTETSKNICIFEGIGMYDLDGNYSSSSATARKYKYVTISGLSEGDVLRVYYWGKYDSSGDPVTNPTVSTTNGRYWTAYDGTTVKPSQGASSNPQYIVPSGINKVIVSINVTDGVVGMNADYIMLFVNNEFYPSTFIPSGTSYKVNTSGFPIISGLLNKTGVAFGDSITEGIGSGFNETQKLEYGYRWTDRVASMLGCKIINCGFGGTRYSNTGGSASASFTEVVNAIVSGDYSSIEDYIANDSETDPNKAHYNRIRRSLANLQATDFSEVDFVLLSYGTNDFGGGVLLDNNDNPLDTSKVLGAMRKGINDLLTAFPNLKVFVLAPIYRYDTDTDTTPNSAGLYLYEYASGICECANKFAHLPAKNMFYESNINKFNCTELIPGSSVHPNNAGYEVMADCISGFLASVY